MDQGLFNLMALVALILSLWSVIKIKSKNTFRRRSSYENEVLKYFENMRWYGFKDEDIADMLHSDHPNHDSLKSANKKARKERVGKI